MRVNGAWRAGIRPGGSRSCVEDLEEDEVEEGFADHAAGREDDLYVLLLTLTTHHLPFDHVTLKTMRREGRTTCTTSPDAA